jgi:hypothetical protein
MQLPPFVLFVSLFIATVAATLVAFECGLRFGRWRSQQPDPEPQLPVRTLVASILSLLAFILGFVFGLASNHHDSRSQAVFDEAIAIGTAYHRADFLPDTERVHVRRLLREYVDLRVEAGRAANRIEKIAQLRHLQKQIWAQAVTVGKKDFGPPSPAPLIQAISEVIDVHGERVLADVRARVPFRVWLTLYGIMALCIAAAGYQAGLAGARRSVAAVAYAFVFAGVIVLIAAGDVPGTDQLRSSHQALIDLRARLTP